MQNERRRVWFLAVNERLGYASLLNTERKSDFDPKPGALVPAEIAGEMGGRGEKVVVVRVYEYDFHKRHASGWGIEAIDAIDRLFEAMGVIGFNERPELMKILGALVREAFEAGVEWSARAPADHHKKRTTARSDSPAA